MQATKRRGSVRRGGLIWLSPEEIETGLIQPRESFDDTELRELADSIAQLGILHPLTVRLRNNRYELIAGERRLRAAGLLGLREVPCTLLDVTLEEASLIALVENLQRRDLDFVEEANGIRRLIELFGMNQEEAARRLGKSQSAVANKLRLLKLPPDVLAGLKSAELSERHGRALLRLGDEDSQRSALAHIIAHGLNVTATDAYIDSLLLRREEKPERKRVFVLKDVRVFVNTVTHGLELMKQSGINADLQREETDNALVLRITIPKKTE